MTTIKVMTNRAMIAPRVRVLMVTKESETGVGVRNRTNMHQLYHKVGVERIELSASRSRTERSTDDLHPVIHFDFTLFPVKIGEEPL